MRVPGKFQACCATGRGVASKSAFDVDTELPPELVAESIPAKIPMYCGESAKDHYIGEASMDFTNMLTDYWKFMTSGTVMDMAHMYWHSSDRTVQMLDARALGAAEGLSKRDFFHKHGFVLLDHQSAMDAEDWAASEYEPLVAHARPESMPAKQDFTEGNTPVGQKYNEEVVGLLQTLMPSATDVVAPMRGIRRGPGSAYENVYGSVVHTDFPVDYNEFRDTNAWLGCADQIQQFESSSAAAYFVINLWRPILPMTGPVKSTPLAVLHPATLEYKDFVKVDLIGGQFPEGQSYLHVRYRPEHKWFYYPDMTVDEVLVWKQAHFVKGEPLSRMPVPHTAFKHPSALETEPRCSFEHRVTIFCSTADGH
eukprot:SAG11_NODE_726_length_7512_cov_23.219479_4_plen_367_part_00